MKTYLKIKGLSLAAEARILKRLERSRNTHPKLRANIHEHRVLVVRPEARASHLALGFLRGRTLDQMEQPHRPLDMGHIATKGQTRSAPNWKRVEELVIKYGQQYFASKSELLQRFTEFKTSGAGLVADAKAA